MEVEEGKEKTEELEELHDLIKNIRPDIRFLGIDYKDREYTGDDLNIPIHWIDRNHGWSTTKLKDLITAQTVKQNPETYKKI